MLKERMQCELAEKLGEFALGRKKVSKKQTKLQCAFEYLAYLMAFSNLGADRTINTELKSWKVIEETFNLPRSAAKLLLQITYQCPKELRIAHLSQTSQVQYLKCLDMMREREIVVSQNDFYGEYFTLTPRFMRSLAFGYRWKELKSNSDFSIYTKILDDLFSNNNRIE